VSDEPTEQLKKPQPDWFARFASVASGICGSRWAFIGAISVVVAWAFTGPLFHYSDAWQLVINTGTTIVTFLMVFLIQNTQNRDSRAINLKLNEMIRSTKRADNAIIDIEKLSDEQLDELAEQYEKIRLACVERRKRREQTRKHGENSVAAEDIREHADA
jgi:low affinity Fe/Cu permease